MDAEPPTPLLGAKALDEPSVFLPENLLREGRRQRDRPDEAVPDICLLDPDGDIVRYLTRTGQAVEHAGWACYHTTLWDFELSGRRIGVVGCAVGASFAVLIAEQLAVSGCDLLLSVTSSGMITALGAPPYATRGPASTTSRLVTGPTRQPHSSTSSTVHSAGSVSPS